MARCILCGDENFVPEPRGGPRCQSCGSLARTRMLGLAVIRAAPPANGQPVIHVAPERGLVPLFRARYGHSWIPADVDPARYQKKWIGRKVEFCDLSNVRELYQPGSVRGFIHSHVLEHVPAPIDCVLSEMNDAVGDGGFHAFIVPGPFPDRYSEDLSPNVTPEERKERFGHPQHLRVFGREDWNDIVLRQFEGWTKVNLADVISEAELKESRIPGEKTLSGLSGKTVHLFIKN